MRTRSVILAIGTLLVIGGGATASLVDGFDTYTDQASFEAAWRPWSANGSSLTFTPGIGRDGGAAVHGFTSVNYQMRNARNLDSFTDYLGTDANPVMFEFWLYDGNPAAPTPPSGARNTTEIRAYTGNGIPAYGTGTLQGLIAMGLYNAPVSDDNFHVRVLYGGVDSWFNLNTPRTAGWHKLTSLIGDTSVQFLVDGALDTTVPLTNRTKLYAFDGVVLGSGLTSGGYDVAFDDLQVKSVPEPATLLLLAASALFMRRSRRA